ncbi:MAG: tetratricopeptide repeat protein [Ktedonobacteraceae bacterium]
MIQRINTSEYFPDNTRFVGRTTFVATLAATLLRDRKVVVTGMSGVGKTAVVREYAQHFSQQYQFVCWLNMATDETLLADLLDIMHMLSLPITMTQGISGLFQALQQYLFTQQQFLMVLDNPPTPFTLQNTPEQQQMAGHLVIITHTLPTSSEIPCLELTGLEAQEGALLVLRQAGLLTTHETLDQAEEEQHLAALELARELHGLPIGLNLAGGYLRETGCSVQDYLFLFRDCPARLHLPASTENEDMAEVAVACELNLAHLEQAQSPTLEYLQVSAHLLPEAIPGMLFQQEAERTPRPEDEPTPEKENIQSLLIAGLLTTDYTASTLSMHPLVQDFVRRFFALDGLQQPVEQALRLFQHILPLLATETLSTRLRIAGHIRHLAHLSEQWPLFSDEAAEVFSWAAWLLWEQGLVATAEPLLRRALVIWERTLGNAHPKVANILGHLAMLNSLLQNHAEAEALSQRAIVSKSKALGVNHPDVLLALDQLGHIYAAQGKQQEARHCYEKAISIGERVGLRQHPAYSTARYDLALLYIEQEQFKQAETLLRTVCMVWGRSLGPQDPSTMAARFSLAEVSVRMKNWERAETCYQQALPICEQLLGAEHPVTLGHLERAAMVFLQRGNLAEAQISLQRVLATRERTLGVQHPYVASCLNGLAQVALAQEQLTEALALLERAQSISANQAKPDNLALAAVLDTLASVEIAQQHTEQAIATYQRALDLRRRTLGKEHLDLVKNLSNLATLYLALAQSHQAEPLLLQALFIYQNAQKPEDLTLDPVLNSLAEIALERQQFAKAKMYLERLRAIRGLALGQADPRTTEVVQKLAGISHAQK